VSKWSDVDGRDFFLGIGQSEGIQFYINDTPLLLYYDDYPFNEWNHCAISRSGNNFKMFLNGEETASATSSESINNNYNVLKIGDDEGSNNSANGRIDEVRITKGVARYTSNFTPPTQPFPNQ
jgi:hypothetical protein